MRLRKYIAALLFLAGLAIAHAGAWGSGSFENDDALDWVENELKPGGLRAVERTVARVAASKGYLESPQGSCAIAACELLAALQGRPSPGLPEEIAAIIKQLPGKVSDTARKSGRDALDRVLGEDSELHSLWKENQQEYENWRKAIEDLKSRI